MKRTKLYGTTTLSSKGQLTIPVGVRARLHLRPGQKVVVAIRGADLVFTLLAPTDKRRKAVVGAC
jgi:AbrB family looped-hinge helix DNA binding protein